MTGIPALNYPYNGGQSCFLLERFVNVFKWWCIPILQLILLSGALHQLDSYKVSLMLS